MADKAADDTGWKKLLNRVVAGGSPYLERFLRTKVMPYAVNSKPFNIIMKLGDTETMATIGKGLPGFWSMLINEIPSEAFISREIGDTVKNITTIFFMEMGHALEGNLSPTPEQYQAAEERAIKAVEDYLEQEGNYDQMGHWHFAPCPNGQGGRFPKKAKLRDILEQHRLIAACCQRHANEIQAKAAEPAKAAEASKAPAIPGRIPAGASVVDILALMPEEARKKVQAWLESLPKKEFNEAAALMTEHLDTVAEATQLAETKDEHKIRFLGLMKDRTKKRKSKIAAARKELQQEALKVFQLSAQYLKDLDQSITSKEKLDAQKVRVQKLRDKKTAREKSREPSLMNLWGMI